MDNSFMGSYVKQKIDDIIEVLKMKLTKDYNAYNINDATSLPRNLDLIKRYPDDKIQQIIKNIDEPILKIKLNEMYLKAIGGSSESERLEAQIEILKNRIEEIKEGNDKN
jgi:hypothetical protein